MWTLRERAKILRYSTLSALFIVFPSLQLTGKMYCIEKFYPWGIYEYIFPWKKIKRNLISPTNIGFACNTIFITATAPRDTIKLLYFRKKNFQSIPWFVHCCSPHSKCSRALSFRQSVCFHERSVRCCHSYTNIPVQWHISFRKVPPLETTKSLQRKKVPAYKILQLFAQRGKLQCMCVYSCKHN